MMPVSRKHLEPVSAQAPPVRGPTVKQPLPRVRLAVLAMLAVLGTGALLSAWWPATSDHLSASTRTELQRTYEHLAPLTLETVAPPDTDQALDSMHLDTAQRAQLKATLTAQPASARDATRLVWVEVWDFASEDGDVVRLSSAGFSIDCPLRHAPARFAVPVDGNGLLTVTGAVDGGGGITLGIRAVSGPVMLPVLAPGQSLALRVGL